MENEKKKELHEADACSALGASVGALGIGAGVITGSVCPLCYIVPPILIGVGLWKRANLSEEKQS